MTLKSAVDEPIPRAEGHDGHRGETPALRQPAEAEPDVLTHGFE